MSEEIKPVNCGCGGKAIVILNMQFLSKPAVEVKCEKCGIMLIRQTNQVSEVIRAWNKAMGPETGEWIPVDSDTVNGRCSKCGYESRLYENDVFGEHYCPNCGAWLRLI